MLIHEVTAKLRLELELRHPGAEIQFGAVFNTDTGHKDAGVTLIRADGHPFEVEYSIQFGAVCLSEKDMNPSPLTHADCDRIAADSKAERMAAE